MDLSFLFLSFLILLFALYLLFNNSNSKGYLGINSFYIAPMKVRKRIAESKPERKCKEILERLFSRNFVKIRPDFLKNPITNKNLELDLYNSELKLAVEYNGIQHYNHTPYFHKNINHFETQKARDEWKRACCKLHGITLIEVPYLIKEEHIEDYILSNLPSKFHEFIVKK